MGRDFHLSLAAYGRSWYNFCGPKLLITTRERTPEVSPVMAATYSAVDSELKTLAYQHILSVEQFTPEVLDSLFSLTQRMDRQVERGEVEPLLSLTKLYENTSRNRGFRQQPQQPDRRNATRRTLAAVDGAHR